MAVVRRCNWRRVGAVVALVLTAAAFVSEVLGIYVYHRLVGGGTSGRGCIPVHGLSVETRQEMEAGLWRETPDLAVSQCQIVRDVQIVDPLPPSPGMRACMLCMSPTSQSCPQAYTSTVLC